MGQTLRLYRSLDKLLILLFWEIVKTNNFLLLDVDYKESNVYTETEREQFNFVWAKLYDDFYELKKDSAAVRIIEQSQEAYLLLNKINLLNECLQSLVHLYDNQEIIDEDKFLAIEQ